MDAQALYTQLGRIIETAPDFPYGELITQAQLLWIGRAGALISASGDMITYVEFDMASKKIGHFSHDDGVRSMMLALHKTLGKVELSAPPRVRGSFIPTGGAFDAFASVSKIFQSSSHDLFVVDPYLDETILTEFGESIPDGINVRLLAAKDSVKSSLEPAAKRWISQYGIQRPLTLKLAGEKTLHDRAIFIDTTNAWVLTQSFKDFAKRSPGEIIRADDTAKMKIDAYEQIWATSAVQI